MVAVWGLSLDHALLVIALILIVADIFFTSELLTHIAYVILTVVVVRLFGTMHPLYMVLTGLVTWLGLVWAHYQLWRKYIQKWMNHTLAPDRFVAGAHGMVGEVGVVRVVEGESLIEIGGDLWRFESSSANMQPGDRVRVGSVKSGVLIITPLSRSGA